MDEPPRHTPSLDLLCPPQTGMLSLIRRVVAAVLREIGFAPEQASLIELSVDEACTNVIHHAYASAQTSDCGQPILRVQICPALDHVAIRVIDQGRGVPPEGLCGVSSAEEYASRPQPKGLGMFIIGRFMDKVEYDSPPGSGIVLSMVKYLRVP